MVEYSGEGKGARLDTKVSSDPRSQRDNKKKAATEKTDKGSWSKYGLSHSAASIASAIKCGGSGLSSHRGAVRLIPAPLGKGKNNDKQRRRNIKHYSPLFDDREGT